MSKTRKLEPLNIGIGSVGIENAKKYVVGRDTLVAKLWARLETSSVRLLAERRMGKTWVLQLALANCPEVVRACLFDAQQCGSTEQFIEQLNKKLHEDKLLPDFWVNEVYDWSRRNLPRISGKKVGTLDVPKVDTWESFLQDTCRNFVEHCGDKRAVLMIDELPFFLDKLVKAGKINDAIQFLDVLRALRQSLPSLRFLFCGSLGLHIVLKSLRESAYTGQPMNDVLPVDVPPLSSADARYLAGCVLLGKSVPSSNLEAVAEVLAESCSCVPFYIIHSINWMLEQDKSGWSPDDAECVPEALFYAAGDPAEFTYYDSRLEQYYPEAIVDKARAALDILSRKPEGFAFKKLVNLIHHNPKFVEADSSEVLSVLNDLRDDHYLVQHGDQWQFKLEIVRRWWWENRGKTDR